MMKILLTLFILFFSSSVFADDISDFEIEGISVGDSLLDYMTEVEIKNALKNASYLKDNKFVIIFGTQSNINTYEVLQITFKTNDKKYIIYSVTGIINSFKNINECLNIRDEIVDEISELFKKNATKTIRDKRNHSYDKTGNSKSYTVSFHFKSGDYVAVECHDWSKELETKNRWRDELRVDMYNQEFYNFLINEEYK